MHAKHAAVQSPKSSSCQPSQVDQLPSKTPVQATSTGTTGVQDEYKPDVFIPQPAIPTIGKLLSPGTTMEIQVCLIICCILVSLLFVI